MAAETTITSAKAWAPDVSLHAPGDVIPDALVLQTSMVLGEIEGDEPAIRVAYVDDATAAFYAEAAAIDEADPALSEVTVYTGKVAQLVRLSLEQYRQKGTPGALSESVRRAVLKKANEAYLTQVAPTSPAVTPPAGLLNVTGIEDGGAVADNLDGLIDLMAVIEGNGGQVSHLVMAPDAWASLRKFKSAAGSALGILGAGTNDVERRLLDVPVLVSAAMTSGTGLAIDRTAVVSAVGPVRVAMSEHAYFNTDSIALRCTFRFGANLVRPDRVGKFTVTAPSATP